MKQRITSLACLMILIIFAGCQEDSPANLSITHIDFTETYHNKVLDLPDGTYVPDNPDFDINNPETWTGNMAKYINHNYIYSVTYTIKNTSSSIAFDSEVDLHYSFDNDDEEIETIYIGDIKPQESYSASTSIGCTNKQLLKCSCEAF